MMTISMTIGGRLVDVDGDTKLGLTWDSGLFTEAGIKLSRSFGLSIPCTPSNDKAMDMSFSQDFAGVRQSAQCTIVAAGVALNGRVYLQETDGRRYDLIFVYGDLAGEIGGAFTDPVSRYLTDTGLYIDFDGPKTTPVKGGTIPPFWFYAYRNGAAEAGTAATTSGEAAMFPAVNLGWLIETAAQACGYSCSFPANPPQDANRFGLVLPTMNTSAETVCRITGSARAGYTDMAGNLAAAGLTMATRRYKRGRYGANVTCYVLVATKSLDIEYHGNSAVTNTDNVFAQYQGYDFPQSWIDEHRMLDTGAASFHMDAGQWFAVVEWDDMVTRDSRHFWHLTTGYTTPIDCTFTVKDNTGMVQPNEVIRLEDNLPDMSLAQLCQAYCGLCDLLLSVDGDNKVLSFVPLSSVISGTVAVDLDNIMRGDVTAITRYIDGFAQHNYVRCNSASYVAERMRFKRDYPCDNDSLDYERDIVTVPFNEGNYDINVVGDKEAIFHDVTVGANGEVQYSGVLSVFYEAPPNGYALHVQTINDLGVGNETAEATVNAMECKVVVRMPMAKFATLYPGALAVLHGRLWTIKSAVWSGDAAELSLVYLKS